MRVLPMGVELQSLIYSLMAVVFEKMGKKGGTQYHKEADSWTKPDLSLSFSFTFPLPSS